MVDVESLSKVSGGVVDVKSFLVSRNTLGNGKNRKLKISKGKCQMVVAECGGGLHLAMWKWNDGYTRLRVEVSVSK